MTIYLADGTAVPESAVMALEAFEHRWPGATFPGARAAIAAAVLGAVKEEWGVSSDMTVDGVELHTVKGPTTTGGDEEDSLKFIRRFGGRVWTRVVSPWVCVHSAQRPPKDSWPEQPEAIEAEALRQDG